MDLYDSGQSLVLIGFRGTNVGSRVLEQLISGDYKYGSVVVADSMHVVPGLVSQNDLLRVLEAKRNGRLDSLDIQLDTTNNLPSYFWQGAIVINATPTIFPTSDSPSVEKSASVMYDIEALSRGAHVVAAHKSAFGKPNLYREVKDTASANGVMYVPAGTLMGPTRAAEILIWLMENNVKVTSAQGIVNGTTNYILTEMSGGKSYEAALREAQKLGYAEPDDPSSDTQGHDALTKMRVPAIIFDNYSEGELFGLGDGRSNLPMNLRRIARGTGNLGIEGITTELLQELQSRSQTIKLIGSYDGITGSATVGPIALPLDNPLAQTSGTNNVLVLNLEGKVRAINMMSDIYGKVLLQSAQTGIGRYAVRIDYKKMSPHGPTTDVFLIEVTHNANINQLIIKGPGAGSAETAAGLLGAADRIRRKLSTARVAEEIKATTGLQDSM